MRPWPPINDGYSENFASLNRNKRSVALNLKDPGDRRVARALVLAADVVIENNRPGVMDRLGLGYDELRRVATRRSIYCSISAFGQSGPARGGRRLRPDDPGRDRRHERHRRSRTDAPVKCGVPHRRLRRRALRRVRHRERAAAACAPAAAASTSTCRCSAARSRSRRCRRASTSAPGRSPRDGSAPRIRATRRTRRFVPVTATSPSRQATTKLWRAVCDVVGMPELLADDPALPDPDVRAANQKALQELLEQRFVERRSILDRCLRQGGGPAFTHQWLRRRARRPADRAHGVGSGDRPCRAACRRAPSLLLSASTGSGLPFARTRRHSANTLPKSVRGSPLPWRGANECRREAVVLRS